MFKYNKLLDRDFASRTLTVLARSLCCYRDIREPMRRARCDCKYGIADRPDEELFKHYSEQSGCPELNMLAEIISRVPKAEWDKLMKKALKKKPKKETLV
jgi:hypothetical protein